MEQKPNHVRLADLLSQMLVDFAKKHGISLKEARRVFLRATTAYGKKIKDGTLEYDPRFDPSHPMHGWRP